MSAGLLPAAEITEGEDHTESVLFERDPQVCREPLEAEPNNSLAPCGLKYLQHWRGTK